ncbi:MAG: F0F1 ATP synthase subunit B [Planctomycetes bacterium]|nr:F0F1 ATP synthase subunit B [Planctomycetota bacterium]
MNVDLLLLAAEGHGPWWLDPHGIGLAFWTAVTFAIVALILYRNAWGPLLNALDAREQGIVGQKEEAERIRREAEEIRRRYEDQLEGIRKEAQQIINEGEADKKRIVDEAHARAGAEARAIRERAERDITLAKEKALAELKAEAIQLGMTVAERVIGAEVDAARHKVIIDEVLAAYERR